jgi:voltage-gated potassium channel
MLYVERGDPQANIHTASDALWWTYVSVTTVGYGDRFPVSDAGRLVGAVTLTLGVGLFGTLTGFLTNAFLRPRGGERGRPEGDEVAVRAELAEIRRQLQALQGQPDAARPTPPAESRDP